MRWALWADPWCGKVSSHTYRSLCQLSPRSNIQNVATAQNSNKFLTAFRDQYVWSIHGEWAAIMNAKLAISTCAFCFASFGQILYLHVNLKSFFTNKSTRRLIDFSLTIELCFNFHWNQDIVFWKLRFNVKIRRRENIWLKN